MQMNIQIGHFVQEPHSAYLDFVAAIPILRGEWDMDHKRSRCLWIVSGKDNNRTSLHGETQMAWLEPHPALRPSMLSGIFRSTRVQKGATGRHPAEAKPSPSTGLIHYPSPRSGLFEAPYTDPELMPQRGCSRLFRACASSARISRPAIACPMG